MRLLLIVDMQNDFVTGALKNDSALAIVHKIQEEIASYRDRGDAVWYTKDTHTKDYLNTSEGKRLPIEHCIKGTWGHDIVKELSPLPDDTVIEKGTFGYNGWEAYKDRLTQYSDIEIVGTCTDICVVSQAILLKTLLPETPISCKADLCAGLTAALHQAALDVMASCQIDIAST